MQKITQDEVKLYDRQIRLWGMEAQQKLRNARILISGVTCLTNEILKNLVLAGVSLILVQSTLQVSEQDVDQLFFLDTQDVGLNKAECLIRKAQALNPRVQLLSSSRPITQFKDTDLKYDIIIMIQQTPSDILYMNEKSRKLNILFFAAEQQLYKSVLFSDLQEFTFIDERKVSSLEGMNVIKKQTTFTYSSLQQCIDYQFGWEDITKKGGKRFKKQVHPFYFSIMIMYQFYFKEKRFPTLKDIEKVLSIKQSYLKRIQIDPLIVPDQDLIELIENRNKEFGACAAIHGGFVTQEVFKALTRKHVPFCNWFIHDGWESTALVIKVV